MSDQPPSRERTRDRGTPSSSESDKETTDSERESETETKTCPECDGNITTDHSRNERTCDDCGLVLEDEGIDHGPEWRAYNKNERDNKSRVGPARTELRHDRGMSATIDWKNKDAYGNQLSATKRAQMQRLRTWDKRSKQSSGDRGIAYANGEIMRMGSALGTPKSIRETAGSLYRQAQEAGLVPGRSIEGMASAVLYIALRVHEEPRSLDEIARVSRVERKPISRAHRYICRELDIPLKPTNPAKYIPRFAGEIGVSQEILRTAEEFIQEIDGHHMSGCDPTVLAGAALYSASIVHGDLVTQHSVKDAADVTEVSIRNNYKQFLIHVDSVDLSEEDVNAIDSPIGLCKEINREVSYNESTRNTQSKSDTDSDSDSGSDESESSDAVDDEHASTTDEEKDTDSETVNDGGDSENEDEFECEECSFTSHSQKGVSVHETRTHSDDGSAPDSKVEDELVEDGQFDCQYCPKAFDSHRGLRVHQGKEHDGAENDYSEYPNSEYNFKCLECDSVFQTYKGLGIHASREHDVDDVEEERCRELCAVDPTEHLVTAVDAKSIAYPDDAYNFKCHHCGRVLSTYQGLSTHIGHQHPDVKKHDWDAYAVDPIIHPVTGAESEDAITGIDIGHSEEPEFREYVGDTLAELDSEKIGQPVIQLAKTLLLAGGRDAGIDTYRAEDSAIGAALYAAQKLIDAEHIPTATQAEIADAVGTSQLPVSQHYDVYMTLFDEEDYDMTDIIERTTSVTLEPSSDD